MDKPSYALRAWTESDYEFVYQVKKEAYKKYVEEYFGGWDEALQREYFKKFADTYCDGIRIITVDGKNIGFFNGEITESGYELGNICIIPEYRGRGIGTAFIEHIENALREMGINHIFLQTDRDMPAYDFYLRRGFTELVNHVSFVRNV